MTITVLLRVTCAWLLVACCLLQPLAAAALLVPGEPQSFSYTDAGPFAGMPLTVYYFKPKTAGPDARVLFALHGVERSGQRARDNWTEFAEKNNFIVLAPEFDAQRFPMRLFQLGGMEDRDSSHWTFALIEGMFDRVKREEGLTASTYDMFGHSAGAQFVQRFVLMMDKARVGTAVAANAGTYTMPVYSGVFDHGFPHALDERRVSTLALKQAMRRHLVVLLGEQDTKTDGPDVPRSKEAVAQGANRYERGQNFFRQARAQAGQMGADLQWQLVTVPGVGHDSRKMSRAAGALFVQAPAR
jgi:poly(3-hydroxybutyrate) depolymerase